VIKALVVILTTVAAILMLLLSLIALAGAFSYHELFLKQGLIEFGLLFVPSLVLFKLAFNIKL